MKNKETDLIYGVIFEQQFSDRIKKMDDRQIMNLVKLAKKELLSRDSYTKF